MNLKKEAWTIARLLRKHDARLVLAESCTGGMVAAALAGVPGISDNLCGSAVVYRDDTKAKWLGISRAMIEKHGAVSRVIASEMAKRALIRTPEAGFSAAVTGHLGPGAPRSQDGLVYVGLAWRQPAIETMVLDFVILPQRVSRAKNRSAENGAPWQREEYLRERRQLLASHTVLFMVRSLLETAGTVVSRKVSR